MTPTQKELDAIQERRKALKSLPWRADHKHRMFVGARHAVIRSRGDPLITGLAGVIIYNPATKEREYDPYGKDDAEFIANAPDDVDTLLELVKEQAETVREARKLLEQGTCLYRLAQASESLPLWYPDKDWYDKASDILSRLNGEGEKGDDRNS